ncbi:MAG: hypothetical protein JJU11_04710 [Candidatus Sumerlaeia bacterium]|nr:hypothetical protein [Candidatus Sumerlaeia bacterium]
MIYFIDLDIIFKLSAYDLIPQFTSTFQIEVEDIRVPASFRFRTLKPGRRLTKRYGEEALKRAHEFVDTIPLVKQGSQEEKGLLDSIEGIDAGEGEIISGTLEQPEFYFMTGDKRALRAIHQAGDRIPTIRKRLTGRVIILEQVTLMMINKIGFELVREKIITRLDVDVAMRSTFGGGMATTEERCREALEMYINQARKETGDLLWTNIPPGSSA